MQPFKKVRVFTNKYPLIGPSFWIVSIQYFITMFIVGLAWVNPVYSYSQNAISDLGNTACGEYADRFVCSPLHNWMNASFIVLGITMIAGSGLIFQEFKRSKANRIGFTFMALAGLGTIFVGLFPENTIKQLHYLGALLPFLLGNVALLIFAFSLDLPRKFQIYTFVSGFVAIIALPLFLTKHYLGLGEGGLERVISHPQTIWITLLGIYMSRDHFRNMRVRFMQALGRKTNQA